MTVDQQLRESTAALSAYAAADVAALFAQAQVAAEASEVLKDVLPGLMDAYAATAGFAAVEWYDLVRDKAGVPGSFVADPAPLPDDFGTEALVDWSVSISRDVESMQTLVTGGVQRRIADVPRQTVTAAAVADPAAKGWQRIGDGSCAFCQMLISRGAVYSDATARFASHDNCNCSAHPAWGGEPLPVEPYTPSSRRGTDADRARVREYLRTL